MDRITKEQRSKNMAAVKGKGNKSTELKMVALLKENKITGWQRHYPIEGTPDFVFRKQKLAVFIDGCFWHGCPKCYQLPKTNQDFWRKKVWVNKARDKKVDKRLRKKDWNIIHIWEHQMKKSPQIVASKIAKVKKFYEK